ncbi:MAG TPA: hypothetical protein VK147_04685 [Candidatus Didemnitutus sp.]|nr:hypothetical protein [Candidatus Didemnitutus sp.]
MAKRNVVIVPMWLTLVDVSTGTSVPIDGSSNHPSLFQIASDVLHSHATYPTMYLEDDRGMRTVKVKTRGATDIEIFLEGGDTMQRSNLVDIQIMKQTGTLDENTLALQPFYGQIRGRSKQNRALLLLQKTGTRSITSTFLKALTIYIRDHYQGYKIEHGIALPQNVVDQIVKEGGLLEVKLIKYGAEDNVVDVVNNQSLTNSIKRTTLTLTVADGSAGKFWKQPAARYLSGHGNVSLNNLYKVNFAYDDIRLVFKDEDGAKRTINVKSPDALRWTEVITDRVKFLNGRFDEYDLQREFDSLANKLL